MNLLCFWCSLALIAICALVHPSRMDCPAGWHNNGVRPAGHFECTQAPVGDPDWDGTWQRPERGYIPDGVLHGRIYCTNGFQPIVVNERTVGCQRVSPSGGRVEMQWTPLGVDADIRIETQWYPVEVDVRNLRELPSSDPDPAATADPRY